MREPAVVRSPAVQMLSLTPSGTPASAPGSSPAATRRSIASAVASASASATVRKAPTRGSTAAMRVSAARVSATAEISRRRTRAAASRTESSWSALTLLDGLLDDLGNAEEPPLARRRTREQLLAGGRIGDLVLAQQRAEVLDVRGRLDAARVDRAQPGEGVEDVVEVGGQARLLVGLELQSRKGRHLLHLLARDRHGT